MSSELVSSYSHYLYLFMHLFSFPLFYSCSVNVSFWFFLVCFKNVHLILQVCSFIKMHQVSFIFSYLLLCVCVCVCVCVCQREREHAFEFLQSLTDTNASDQIEDNVANLPDIQTTESDKLSLWVRVRSCACVCVCERERRRSSERDLTESEEISGL